MQRGVDVRNTLDGRGLRHDGPVRKTFDGPPDHVAATTSVWTKMEPCLWAGRQFYTSSCRLQEGACSRIRRDGRSDKHSRLLTTQTNTYDVAAGFTKTRDLPRTNVLKLRTEANLVRGDATG